MSKEVVGDDGVLEGAKRRPEEWIIRRPLVVLYVARNARMSVEERILQVEAALWKESASERSGSEMVEFVTLVGMARWPV